MDSFWAPQGVAQKNDERVQREVLSSLHLFAESLGNAIDAKDHCTCLHSEEVAIISQAIGVQLGLSPMETQLLHIAGHLHDIGKIGVPDSILKKDNALTDEEYLEIKRHPQLGAEIVTPVMGAVGNGEVVKIILHHHERYDGKGYPEGLCGKDIPLGARIIAVADSLSAMLQNRPYRNAMEYEQAVAEIVRSAGTQFDPVVVAAFLQIQDSISELLQSIRCLGVAV
ncbi:HD-GYP domain-containing protein [Halodesulfovibrio aestuarii]|uniref:HD domain-containing protein n=1 Tax=Halodesulfovibrio aestuarii TaxID=126333 RepID=A0A8G2CA01_9BACT|nr:HD-GYP domain-containing protein [Halodesulfovibrio aestuarii]SHJ24029.1 HD domain-containing protein [Halodesulfovibrio aestuarii]